MPQARGARSQLILQRETEFRTPPGAPAGRLIPFTTWGYGRDPRRQENQTIQNSALPRKRDQGDPWLSGPFTSVLDLRSIGNWLALLYGVPVANKAVTQQPTNVTGVTIHYAEADCASGNGTLAYTDASTSLAWTANGDIAGAPVDVSAGGQFLIPSDTATSGVYVTVAAAALPGADQTDADIAVSATLKAHVFPQNLADRPSALAEMGHPDITKFYRSLGLKLNRLAWDVVNNEQNISGELIGAVETEETSAWDATPTSYEQFRACSAAGRVTDGAGGTLGGITAASMDVNNQMEGKDLADGEEGYGFVDQGDIMLGGRLTALFTGEDAYAAARANTSTRLRIVSGATIGADTFRLIHDIPAAELLEPRREVNGKSGMYVEIDWRAHEAGGLLPVVTLENDVTSY